MKDIFDNFCDSVCSKLDYATYKESEGVRAEPRAHLEDHTQALIDIGRSEDEAREAAVSAMGDPEEIGKELNKQFPFIWLFLSRATVVIAIILALLLISPLRGMYYRVSDSMIARNSPMELYGNYGSPIDIRVELPENDIAYFYSCDIELFGNDWYRAIIGLVIYDKSPMGRVSNNSLDFRIEMEDGFFEPSGGSFLGYGTRHKRMLVDVEKGQEKVELFYTHYDTEIKVEIPLDWEGVE